MLKRICMVGIKGIGKTTLSRSILSRVPWIDYIIGSSILRELVGEEFKDFDKFSDERKRFFREQANRYMEQHQKENRKDILVDGHTTLYNSETGKVDAVFTELDYKFYTDLIYYNAPAKVVLKRRKGDPSKRRILDINIIKQELAKEKEESIRIAKTYQIGWYEIKNGNLEKMQEDLFNLLKTLH